MVCVAGYDVHLNCIRLVTPKGGFPEHWLYQDGKPIIFPFSVIEIGLTTNTPQPPHTEDSLFDPESIRYVRQVRNREAFLKKLLFPSVNDIFEQEIYDNAGFYVHDCSGPRSIGTIKPGGISEVIYAPESNKGVWDYRILFVDDTGKWFRLKITDLTWQHYCDHLRSEGMDLNEIAEKLTEQIKSSKVYLRIGLARGWKLHPDRCYLQVNGIYTFPDYLQGKNFHDFKSLNYGTRETPDHIYGEVEEPF